VLDQFSARKPGIPVEDVQKVLHELMVTQAELELQNEELRDTRNALEDSLERLFQLFENAPVGFCVLNTSGVVLKVNMSALTMLGALRPHLVGVPLSIFVAPEHHERFFNHRRRVLRQSEHERCELTFARRDGTVFFGRVQSVRLPRGGDPDGISLLCSIIDVTAERRAVDALRKSESRFRALFEQSRDAVFLIDWPSTRVQEANAEACSLFRVPSERLAGEPLARYFAEDFRALIQGFVDDAGVGNSGEALSTVVHVTSGEEVPVEVKAVQLQLDGGRLVQVILRNVAESLRLRRESRRLEEELRQSQKLQAIGRLAGGVAHEMNNILNIVMNLTHALLERSPLSPSAREDVGQIDLAARRGRDLTQNLLSFARRSTLLREPLGVNECVRDVERMVQRRNASLCTVALELHAEPSDIVGDRSLLTQALMNLCGNALDAMPSGGTLTLHTRNQQGGIGDTGPVGNWVVVEVLDTGCGIPTADLERVFEPFYTTKNATGGTGLGLPMVYGTVQEHGGLVSLDSQVGKGTRVRILLPALQKVEGVVVSASTQAVPAPRRTVMVVDDESMVLRATCRLLTAMGYEPVPASDGERAIEIFRADPQRIALVILDMSMPGFDGLQTMQGLFEIDPTAKILLSSGWSEEHLGREWTARPNVRFLRKPYDRHELSQKLEGFFSDAR
jgi:PAS domain S-box-containing protein